MRLWREILRRVGLEKLLEDAGLNSWLGEGGRQLSGGELRRLAIARALLHDAPLVLLDEPTEGLDATTESQILELLAEMMCENGVNGHPSTSRTLRFQQIIVMDNGQIIEQGTHAELLTRQGVITSLSRVCKLLLNDPTCVEFCGHAPGSAFSPFNSLPFPEGALREPNGLLALGGDLSPARLLMAYQRGIFPWFSPGDPILWWSPDPLAGVMARITAYQP